MWKRMDEQKRIITHVSTDCISEVETEVVLQGIITVGKQIVQTDTSNVQVHIPAR